MLPVGFFDRRKLVEVALDARRELLGLGPEQLELTLTLLALPALARLRAEPASGKPRPFRADNGSDSANQKGDHQPAHAAILPAGNRWYIRVDAPGRTPADLGRPGCACPPWSSGGEHRDRGPGDGADHGHRLRGCARDPARTLTQGRRIRRRHERGGRRRPGQSGRDAGRDAPPRGLREGWGARLHLLDDRGLLGRSIATAGRAVLLRGRRALRAGP